VDLSDLHGRLLGIASGDSIILDRDAAGYGWFIDVTPLDDSEFTRRADGSHRANQGTPVQERIDLLTAITHEMGHVLGLADVDKEEDSSEVMASILLPGRRRLPWALAVDSAFGSGWSK